MAKSTTVGSRYTFKPGARFGGLDPQQVGALFDELRSKHGTLRPQDVVEAARDPRSPIHEVFDWDNESAATKYRLDQARNLIRNVEVTWVEPKGPREVEATIKTGRAFVNTTRDGTGYVSLREQLASPEGRAAVLERALEDLVSVQERYEQLNELAGVRIAVADFGKKVAEYKRRNTKPAKRAA